MFKSNALYVYECVRCLRMTPNREFHPSRNEAFSMCDSCLKKDNNKMLGEFIESSNAIVRKLKSSKKLLTRWMVVR